MTNIADPYPDLLACLDERRRMGIVALLAVGYFDGWRPAREEVADLVRAKTGESARQRPELHRLHRASTPARRLPADRTAGADGALVPIDPRRMSGCGLTGDTSFPVSS